MRKIICKFKSLWLGSMVSARFRYVNVAFFVLAALVMTLVMMATLRGVTNQISEDYASHHATSVAGHFSAYLMREIGVLENLSHSSAIIEWFSDEDNPAKKSAAFEDLLSAMDTLSSDNFYIVTGREHREYSFVNGDSIDRLQSADTLDPNRQSDIWYFECLDSEMRYVLKVDIDKLMQKKCVWINYKVYKDGEVIGVVCTGMEFANIVAEILSRYDNSKIRTLIVSEKGYISMDSALLGDERFLRYSFESRLDDEFTDVKLVAAVRRHLGRINGNFGMSVNPTVLELSDKPYRFATIAPIAATTWSVVTLYDSSSLFSAARLLPLFIAFILLFVIFTLVADVISYRLIFTPLDHLVDSLAKMKSDHEVKIFGLERKDEFGILSNTINDLFDEGHHDALTGIYNRRFMEASLRHMISLLSRSGSHLSVLMMDIDFFKKYNDTYGHNMGDDCLAKVAEALAKSITRTDDFVARYGGEEFIVVLPNTDESGARLMADKMLDAVRQLKIPHSQNAAAEYVTVSVGGATGVVTFSQRWNDYVKLADEALYKSKHNGRNQYTWLGL